MQQKSVDKAGHFDKGVEFPPKNSLTLSPFLSLQIILSTVVVATDTPLNATKNLTNELPFTYCVKSDT